jgi:outer membrane protein TolC
VAFILGLIVTAQPVLIAQAQPTLDVSLRADTSGFTLARAVEVTIASSFRIRSAEAAAEQAQGQLVAAKGAFDLMVDASAARQHEQTTYTAGQRAQLGISSSESAVSTYSLGLRKEFRSGLNVAPSLQVSRTDPLTLETLPVVRSGVEVAVTYPVMRGRTILAAQEEASQASLRARRMDAQFTASEELYRAASAYWSYRAAVLSLDIYEVAEERARKLLDDTRQLVAADERPSADLAQLAANLADKTAARVGAEQRVFETRQALGLAMSLSPSEVNNLAYPTTEFPESGRVDEIASGAALERAFSRRLDLQGARLLSRSAIALRDAERNNRRPRFDLQGSVGYTGLSDSRLDFSRHLGPFGSLDAAGPTVSLGIVYRWSPLNRQARGTYVQQNAAYRQQELQVAEVERQIQAGVTVAVNRLRSVALELQSARASVDLHSQTVENEQKKLRLGMSTLFDVTLAEDRLTTALLNRVSAQARFAQAMAQLRLETGLLPSSNADAIDIEDALTSLPAALAAK